MMLTFPILDVQGILCLIIFNLFQALTSFKIVWLDPLRQLLGNHHRKTSFSFPTNLPRNQPILCSHFTVKPSQALNLYHMIKSFTFWCKIYFIKLIFKSCYMYITCIYIYIVYIYLYIVMYICKFSIIWK